MKRNFFLKLLASTPFILAGMNINKLSELSTNFTQTAKMPALFIGHGHPMNALFDNNFTQTLARLGQQIERPQAIIVVSAHWETRGSFVSINPSPQTIYDFGGFDSRLFEIRYTPKGHPELAKQAIAEAESNQFSLQADPNMGLDHGAWTVLKHIFPQADIPVFQISIDYSKPPIYHFELANALKKMREKGVLVIGSGNIVHNLRILDWQNINAQPFDWAIEFDELVKKHLDQHDFNALVDYSKFGKLAQLAVPTNDHYLPMLYTLGLADKNEKITHLFEGHQYGSISMRCFMVETV